MSELDRLREDRRRLAEDLRLVVRDTDDILRHKIADAGDEYELARRKLEQSILAAKDRLGDLESLARERAENATEQTDAYVRAHPWESMGMGAGVGVGVGVLIGLLVGRK